MTETVPDRIAVPAEASESPGRIRSLLPLEILRPSARRPAVWTELLLVGWLCWVYDMIANLAPVRVGLAESDARGIFDAERWLHLDPEKSLDHWLSRHHTLAVILANYYDNAHFVVTLSLLGFSWLIWSRHYRGLRNSLLLINLIGMVVFWLLPTAPPRLFEPAVFPDVVAATHAFGSWHSGTLAHAANQYAAMPSLHIGWACWSSLAAWRILGRRRWAALVWLYPVATAVAVMATGNHFLLDVVAGVATFAVSTWVADRWSGWWTTRQAVKVLGQGQRPDRVVQ